MYGMVRVQRALNSFDLLDSRAFFIKTSELGPCRLRARSRAASNLFPSSASSHHLVHHPCHSNSPPTTLPSSAPRSAPHHSSAPAQRVVPSRSRQLVVARHFCIETLHLTTVDCNRNLQVSLRGTRPVVCALFPVWPSRRVKVEPALEQGRVV